MRNNRLRVRILQLFIKFPVVFIGITLTVILSPVAILHYSSWASDSSSLRDGSPKMPPDKSKHADQPAGRQDENNVLIVPDVGGKIGKLREKIKSRESRTTAVECQKIRSNPHKPDFDLANLTYTLTDLKWDGDRGVWDEEMEARYYKLHPTIPASPQVQSVQTQNRKIQIQNATVPLLSSNDQSKPLLVYVVPFSHADPGWLNTVEEYFDTSIKFVLHNMLKRLQEWPDMTFIWAETSYFKMWWDTINANERNQTKELLKSGRLEIVNGGYVMPDEASCHYYAILHQYVYGHQWLLENLGVVPEHGFSIDPFGHSSSMPYFLKNLDFKTMFIQRIHYNLRKHLVRNKASEFMWEQLWDEKNTNSMFCHLSPHHLYTIKNICSLSPGNCYLYDFHELVLEINNQQLEDHSKMLLENLRKTSSVYQHNVLLYILGDDFRWVDPNEWTKQYTNYKRIMKVLNEDPSKNVVMKFGTLKDYYNEVFKNLGSPEPDAHTNLPLPKVQGDFFPYADKYEDYWTGYFTSRPFYKQMSRELERDLRSAEILYSLAKLRRADLSNQDESDFYDDLVGLERATMALGLFQHHDAITGTSKRAVALDYGEKLQNGLLMAHAVILRNVFRIAQLANKNTVKSANIILDTFRLSAISLPVKSILQFTEADADRKIFLFNPLARSRVSVVHLLSETQNLLILDADGQKIPYQVSPSLSDMETRGEFLTTLRISLYIELQPLALKVLTVKSLGARTKKIRIAERFPTAIKSTEDLKIPGFVVEKMDPENMFTVSNSHISVTFMGDTGMLQSIKTADGISHKIEMEFKRYETQASGAYLFRPNGVGDLLPYPRNVHLLQGSIFSEVHVVFPSNFVQIYRIYNSSSDLGKTVEMETISQLQNYLNAELILKFSTKIKNNQTFFTDSNGFQMVKRRVNQYVPMSANYYPVTSTAFLQDKNARISLHFTQGHGVGSQRSSELEVMLDRFLMQDDARGVGEALQDLRNVRTQMWLQVETGGFCTENCVYNNPTSIATNINLERNNPLYVTFEQTGSNLTAFDFLPVKETLPCDVHLVMMKPVTLLKTEKRVGLMLHRNGMDCSKNVPEKNPCQPGKDVQLDTFLHKLEFSAYNHTGLNFAKIRATFPSSTPAKVEHMSIAAFTVNVS